MSSTWSCPDGLKDFVQGVSGNVQVGMAGVEGALLVARVAAAVVGGKRFAVAAIAIGERFPEGALEGTVMHWGCSNRPGGGWDPPPPGWHTLPPVSFPAGESVGIGLISWKDSFVVPDHANSHPGGWWTEHRSILSLVLDIQMV